MSFRNALNTYVIIYLNFVLLNIASQCRMITVTVTTTELKLILKRMKPLLERTVFSHIRIIGGSAVITSFTAAAEESCIDILCLEQDKTDVSIRYVIQDKIVQSSPIFFSFSWMDLIRKLKPKFLSISINILSEGSGNLLRIQ